MKKIACLLISFILIMGSVYIPASAEGISILGVSFSEFYSPQGETSPQNGNGQNSVILKSREWIKFDLRDLALNEGYYQVSLLRANTQDNSVNKKNLVSLNVSVENETNIVKEIPPTPSVSTFEEIVLGDICINEDSKYIKIENISVHTMAKVDIDRILLTKKETVSFAKAEFSGMNVLSTVSGEGYYDVAGADFFSNSVTPMGVSCGSIMLHGTGDWAAYDISGLPSGVYNITISSAERVQPKITVLVDDIAKFENVSVNLSGAYGTYTDTDLGDVYISSQAEVLKIKNLAQATEIRCITLSKISDSIVLDAKSYDGFYDNNGESAETGANGIVLRNSEWINFNMGKIGLAEGNYSVSLWQTNQMTGRTAGYIDLYADDILELKKKVNASSLNETELGVFYIKSDLKTLTLKNSSVTFDSNLEIEKLVLTPTKQTTKKIYTYDALNISSKNFGEGYFDTQNADFWESKEVSGSAITPMTTGTGAVVLHNGDWVEYDISNLAPGTYDFSVLSSERLGVIAEVSIDGKIHIDGKMIEASGGYGEQFETVKNFGRIYISSDAKKLKIKNTLNATYLKSFTLKKISDMVLDVKEYELDINCILSKTEGEGYHDENNAEFSDFDFLQTGCFKLDKSDWVKLDVSHIPTGKYVAYANFISDGTKLSLYEGNNIITEEKSLESEVEYERDFNLKRLGIVDLNVDSEFIKVLNSGENEILLKNIVLKTVSAPQNIKYTSDAEGENEISSLADSKTVYLSGLIEEYEENEVVTITVAMYKDGSLSELKRENIVSGNETEINLSNMNADTIKTFIWDEENKPLGEVKTLYSGKKTHIFVSSESGNDLYGNGSEENPYKTIEFAKSKVRELNKDMQGDIVVHLNGEFYLDETLSFDENDSGTNGFNIIYDGENNAEIYGGVKLSDWSEVSNTGIYAKKIEGINDFRQFYINGNRGVRARSEYLYKPMDIYNDGISNYVNNTVDGFIVKGSEFDGEFSKTEGMEFVWQPSWKNIRIPVSDIEKTETGDLIFKFRQPYFDSTLLTDGDGMPKPTKDTPFYIENAVEFLDEPGEWFFDKDTKMLYYYPTENEDMSTAECFIPKVEKFLDVKGSEKAKVCNITFKNTQFSYAGWNEPNEKGFITHQAELMITPINDTTYGSEIMPAHIEVENAENINFVLNEFSHLGSVAVSMSNKTTDSVIEGNIFDDISATAIVLGDDDMAVNTPKEDLCSFITVSNNLIRRTAVEYQTPIITAYYLRESSIRNNDIKDAPYTGISLGWGWGNNVNNSSYNDVIGNRIENVMFRLNDGGHIYTLGKQTGTVISENYMLKSEDYHGGVYLDNSSSEISVLNNVFESCPKWVRMLYTNVKNNVGRNNYSDTIGSTDDKNDFDDAIGKENGQWNDDAKKIIDNAGLKGEYKSLLEKYNQKSDLYRNDALKWLKYDTSPGIVVPAGHYMEGGEGVAYHDVSTVPGGLSAPYEPGRVAVGCGVNHSYITMTGQGEWTKYKVEIPEKQKYDFFLTFVSLGYQYVNIYIDDVLVVNRCLLKKSADDYNDVLNTLTEQHLKTIELDKGEHTVKIEHARSNFVPYKFRLTPVGEVWEGRNDGFKAWILDEIKR